MYKIFFDLEKFFLIWKKSDLNRTRDNYCSKFVNFGIFRLYYFFFINDMDTKVYLELCLYSYYSVYRYKAGQLRHSCCVVLLISHTTPVKPGCRVVVVGLLQLLRCRTPQEWTRACLYRMPSLRSKNFKKTWSQTSSRRSNFNQTSVNYL